mmetsp:Transcript_7750/g.9597  ORF Transcript_7750/g.9597 Transcript_7750/m.9597 type:complete len:203 (+) Transcript_7750:1102-1710(+)|eukprot:CAMPEP_0206208728 /NCGR_PEP_ID=MMETSP0166-20121206/16460_1 /ASSEMBLY_ACC=CAM_ASM_000260 /TAXON_ID=95228 /ORGANISM="Vannella robusta, Strain DIVA3 518/3/11/1/6" /LENGTH=202 /DNA_ID=CAMNT_0053629937 /DNA_START=133 /DNA_END=741 /DNA_ORIENTATION=-
MPTVAVRLLSAVSLLAADINGSSDPYCTFKLGEASYQSKRIPHSLNPTWNESFELEFKSAGSEKLELHVFDHDAVGAHDSLGTAIVELGDLIVGIEKTFWVKLEGGETGENIVATIGNMFKKRKKKSADVAVSLNKGQVQIGLTAIDFGYGYHEQSCDSPMLRLHRAKSAMFGWGSASQLRGSNPTINAKHIMRTSRNGTIA